MSSEAEDIKTCVRCGYDEDDCRCDEVDDDKSLHACEGGPAFHADCWACISLVD